MKIHYIPLENQEQRYNTQMNKIVYPYVDKVYYPDFTERAIKKGQFLDLERTIEFKSLQMALISKAFQDGEVSDGDVFFFADMFFPSIEAIKYMAELQGLSVKIVGFNYAGRADKTDFVQKLGRWSDSAEKSYHDVCDLIFVGSEFHKKNVVNYFNLPESKVIVTGYIWDKSFCSDLVKEKYDKEDYVIFPHRLSAEKGITELLEYAQITDKKIIVTSSGKRDDSSILFVNGKIPENIEYVYGLSKKQYYTIMAKAKWYLSTAYQETFGYTIREATHFSCILAVPNRACCPEMVEPRFVYNSVSDIDLIFNQQPSVDSLMFNKNIKHVINLIRQI